MNTRGYEIGKSMLSYKLREFRQKEGLTQEQLAELLEMSDKSISKWERGDGYPSKRNLVKILEVLGISIEALLIEQGQDESKNLKLSIKYGVISYVFIFALILIINSFRNNYSSVIQEGGVEILKVLSTQFINNNLTALPPAIIIACVFYFYIFPNKEEKEI